MGLLGSDLIWWHLPWRGGGCGAAGAADTAVLSGTIRVEPHSSEAERRVPYVSLEVFQEEWMECLGPDELAHVIQTLRAHLNVLDNLCGRLAEARRVFQGVCA